MKLLLNRTKQKYMDQLEANLDLDDASVDIQAVADEFGVSRQAALFRGRWLGLIEW